MENLPKLVNRICVRPILYGCAVLLLTSAQAFALAPPPALQITKTVIVQCSLSRAEMQNPDLMIEESLRNTHQGISGTCSVNAGDVNINEYDPIFEKRKNYPVLARVKYKKLGLIGDDQEAGMGIFREFKILNKKKALPLLGYENYVFRVALLYVLINTEANGKFEPICEKSVVNIPLIKTPSGWHMMPIDNIGSNLNRLIFDELIAVNKQKKASNPYETYVLFNTDGMREKANRCKLKL